MKSLLRNSSLAVCAGVLLAGSGAAWQRRHAASRRADGISPVTKQKETMRILAILLSNGPGYVWMQGICKEEDAEKMLPEFRKILTSFAPKAKTEAGADRVQ